jgi:hypothetical protein
MECREKKKAAAQGRQKKGGKEAEKPRSPTVVSQGIFPGKEVP